MVPEAEIDPALAGGGDPRCLGWWVGSSAESEFSEEALRRALRAINRPLYLLDADGRVGVAQSGAAHLAPAACPPHALPLLGFAPAVRPQDLGDPGFCADHRLAYPYMTGSMAHGIGSVELVQSVARKGLLGSYGAAGQSLDTIEEAVDQLSRTLADRSYCCNLIHSPGEPAHETAVVDLYLRRGVRLIEASAYLDLTLPAVRYRVHGIRRAADGAVIAPNRVIAKASRIEVAAKWFSPPPAKLLSELVRERTITTEQAELAARIPMAQDLTAEADSGGHTDNRPAVTLLPTLMALRDRLQERYRYQAPLRLGAAGGIATPQAAAAAFAMGAAYVVTGSVNQACVEAGTSDQVRQMLAEAEQADVVMAPAADMFELGVKLQVLKRGTLFPMRAARLYELYRGYGGLEELPDDDRQFLEKTIFRAPVEQIWHNTRDFFLARDPALVARAESSPKQRMALLFRWYLGSSSRWANDGHDARRIDFQIWCGPSMGAFNEWTRGSFMQHPANRSAATVALNILYGAAVLTRAHSLRTQGVPQVASTVRVDPLPPAQLEDYFA